MSKNFFFKFLISLSWLAAAVLWLLSVLIPEKFGFFNLNWVVVITCGVNGAALLLRGLFSKKTGVLKKSDVFWGTVFLVIAAIGVIFALKLPKSYVWPIIAVIVAAAGVLSVFATKGKKWDEGDNQKAGYKDYRARKAEAERDEEKDSGEKD